MSTPQQPTDSWDYVRTDSDDDDELAHPDPEVTALHLEADDRDLGDDPARRDEGALVDGDEGPVATYFADEEPEGEAFAPSDDHEPDLEEILEVQHYAFPAEGAEGDEDGADRPGEQGA